MQNGVVMVGSPVIDPKIESMTVTGDRNAHIVDCVDSANWVLTVKATGELASSTTAANTRVTADAWAIYYENRWVVREVTLNRDDPC